MVRDVFIFVGFPSIFMFDGAVDYLLLESGDYLLLESGDRLKL